MDVVTAIIKIVYIFFLVFAWIEFSCLTYGFGKKSFDRWFGPNRFLGVLLSFTMWPILFIGFLIYYIATIVAVLVE